MSPSRGVRRALGEGSNEVGIGLPSDEREIRRARRQRPKRSPRNGEGFG
ncbi:hypothetical protein [Haladaptatus sp. CMAA 1911]